MDLCRKESTFGRGDIMDNEEIKLENEEVKEAEPAEETKEELPKEENEPKVEEKKEEKGKNVAPTSDIVEINKLTPEDKPLGEDVEEHRQELYAAYNQSRKMSNISMAVVVLFVIGAMVLLMVNQDWSKIVGYSLGGVALIGLIIFSIITKNKFPTKSKQYIRYVTVKMDQFVYNNTEFQDVKVDLNEKYTIPALSVDRIFKSPVDIGSRNIVRGLYLGNGFSCGELALYSAKQEGRKTLKAVAFIGKYIELQNSLHFENRYIINFKGEKPTDLPTDIDDLKELHTDGNLTIYGVEGSDYVKDIPTKYIAALKKLNIQNHLLGVNVVLWAGHTAVYLSYDDPVVALPFDKPFDATSQMDFKDHLLTVLEANKLINK